MALVGKQPTDKDERITDRRIYPWDHNTARYLKRDKDQGKVLANLKKGKGDFMGMAGRLNDNASITSPVLANFPNDFGLYNMGGNVSEWTKDLYRPLTASTLRDVETHDLNPYRGGKFMTKELDENHKPVEKDSLGRMRYKMVEDDDAADRENYKRGQVYDYLDGDEQSFVTYDYGEHTLISDKARVIKGGSWEDRLYWLSPGARRFKEEDKSSRSLGFRCAMTRTGSPAGNDFKGGNSFKRKSKRVKRKFK